MELDKTAITITHRSTIDLIDISLIVIRRYWKSLLAIALPAILPVAIVNFLLLMPLTKYDTLVMATRDYATTDAYQFRYLCVMSGLVFLESPLVLAGVTYFIGRAVFIEEPSIKEVFLAVWTRASALLYIVGFWRLSLAAWGMAIVLTLNPLFDPWLEVFIFGFCVLGCAYCLRGLRPFAAEILLLERCPVFLGKNEVQKLSFRQRSNWLHSAISSDLLGVHIGISFVAVMTTVALSLGFIFLVGVLVGIWQWGFWLDQILYPIVLWCIAIWTTVIRFLLYMNSRIRLEGWEVELKLKAEALRIEEATQHALQ